jgi:hypothetical protein
MEPHQVPFHPGKRLWTCPACVLHCIAAALREKKGFCKLLWIHDEGVVTAVASRASSSRSWVDVAPAGILLRNPATSQPTIESRTRMVSTCEARNLPLAWIFPQTEEPPDSTGEPLSADAPSNSLRFQALAKACAAGEPALAIRDFANPSNGDRAVALWAIGYPCAKHLGYVPEPWLHMMPSGATCAGIVSTRPGSKAVVRVSLLVGHPSLLPPPVSDAALGTMEAQVAQHWLSEPVGEGSPRAIALQRQRTGDGEEVVCWITGALHNPADLTPIIVWAVDPVSKVTAATGLAYVEPQFAGLLSSGSWFTAPQRTAPEVIAADKLIKAINCWRTHHLAAYRIWGLDLMRRATHWPVVASLAPSRVPTVAGIRLNRQAAEVDVDPQAGLLGAGRPAGETISMSRSRRVPGYPPCVVLMQDRAHVGEGAAKELKVAS